MTETTTRPMSRDEAFAELVRLGATNERATEFLEVADRHGVASALRERLEVSRGESGRYLVQRFEQQS